MSILKAQKAAEEPWKINTKIVRNHLHLVISKKANKYYKTLS